jgi:hypothetical protein
VKLIDDWAAQLKRAWSIRLAGVAAVVAGYFVAYPAELQRLVALVPADYREGASVLAGLFVFAAASGARLVRQADK